MEEYIQQGLDFKNQTVEKTIEFIDQQLGFISDSLTIAESKLESFRLSNKLIDLSSEGSAIKTKLEDYTKEKITVGLQKQYYDYLSDYLNTKNESGEIVSPSVMGVTDNMLITLVEELSSLQLQKKQIRYNFSGNQPAITLIDSKIDDARKALDENVRNSIINVERTLKDIDGRITSVEGELNKLPGTERKLINIQRKFDLNNTVYTYMLEKRSEAGIAKASNVSGNRIIDRAEAFNAEMIAPKKNRNYLIALLLGFLLPGLYIIIVEQFQNKILDKKDIEKGTRVPVIGFIGHNNSKNEIPVISKPGSALAESFRSVRTNLRYYLNGENKAVISVTSAISGEGKTFVSLNLATVIAMLGKRTLLVGLDMRRPRLNKLLGSSDYKGLSNFLIGESDFESIINRTEGSDLHFISSGPVPPNPSELIESERMKEFMRQAKEKYDYIILDTPPAGMVSDAMLLGFYSDVNIFVIRQRFSFKSTLDLIQSIFDKKELKNLTIAINDIHISGYFGYGLRYGYGPYQGYGYSYGHSQYGSNGVRNRKYYEE
jgi:capsular exopolysaccharide synthesis family protein